MKTQNIKTGDLLLFHKRKWSLLPRGIEFFQRCKWHHAGFAIIEDGKIYVSEALSHGIDKTPIEEYTNTHDVILGKYKNKDLAEKLIEKEDDIIKLCNIYDGTKYDYFNLLVIQPFLYVTSWLGISLNIKIRDKIGSSAFICGEWYAFMIYKILGIRNKWPTISPEKIYNSGSYDFEVIN